METRRKTVFRLSELDQFRRQLAEPLTAEERARRHRAVERINRFRETMPVIAGDIKDWIRAERGETEDG
jgi:hypothetical protein